MGGTEICNVLDEMREVFCKISEEKSGNGITLSGLRQWDQSNTLDSVISRLGLSGPDAFRVAMFPSDVLDKMLRTLSKCTSIVECQITSEKKNEIGNGIYPASVILRLEDKNHQNLIFRFFDNVKDFYSENKVPVSYNEENGYMADLSNINDFYNIASLLNRSENVDLNYCMTDGVNGCSTLVSLNDIDTFLLPNHEIMEYEDMMELAEKDIDLFMEVVSASSFINDLNEKNGNDIYDVSKIITDLYQIGIVEGNESAIHAMQLATKVYCSGEVYNVDQYYSRDISEMASLIEEEGINPPYSILDADAGIYYGINLDTYDVEIVDEQKDVYIEENVEI